MWGLIEAAPSDGIELEEPDPIPLLPELPDPEEFLAIGAAE